MIWMGPADTISVGREANLLSEEKILHECGSGSEVLA